MTTPISPSPAESEGAPGARRGIRFLVRRAGPAAIVVAATVAAWMLVRGNAAPGAAPAGTAAPDGTPGAANEPDRVPVTLTPQGAARIGVTYGAATRGPLPSDVRTVGLVAYDETRVKAIAPKVDGYVEQLYVAFTGQPVTRGDSLLRIYSPMLVTAQEELLLAKKLADQVRGGDAAQAARDLLASARRRLRNWDIPETDIARIEATGEARRTLTLRSPLTGVVVRKDVLAGQRILAGEPVYQVADLHEVWLEGEVFERDLAAVRMGQAVTAEIEALPGVIRHGRVVYVAPSVTPDTRTTTIRVSLPNPDLLLKPGMFATIHIRGVTSGAVVSVPRSAVLVTGRRNLVFIKAADGMLMPRDVELGASTNDRVEIRRGVAAGDTVVTSATFLVDAESNLSSALSAMASMPGMSPSPAKSVAPSKRPTPRRDSVPEMPEMDHATVKKAP